MRLINALLAAWHTKSTTEKIKMVLHGAAMVGGSVVGNTIAVKCSEGHGKIERVCTQVTGWALGTAVTNVAVKHLDEGVDRISELVQARNKMKEDNTNA